MGPNARATNRRGHVLGSLTGCAALVLAMSLCFGNGLAGAATNGDAQSDEQVLIALANKRWTGDLDGMLERGFIRVLTTYNPLLFHFDGADQRGIVYESTKQLEKDLNKKRSRKLPPIRIMIIPVARDELLSGLMEGRGDVVAANLTVTPTRQKLVQFSDPLYRNVSELVITSAAAPKPTSFDDVAEFELHVRRSSSYFEHLVALNRDRKAAGRKPIPIVEADENLEDYDLLELVNAGMIPAVIVDSHKAKLWAQFFDGIRVNDDLAVHRGGNIAWAARKGSPKLLAALNRFAKEARKGTLLGNLILKRHFGSTKRVKNALSDDGMRRYQETVDLIMRYAAAYQFDWLMVMAQAYQESGLDQSKVSHAGAIGIMQVMPKTAADRNVAIPDIHKVEQNVHAGVKYLRFVRRRYFTDDAVAPVDQILFAFAAYNAGPRAIARARKRAAKLGFDPNRWFGHVEVAAAKVISREPVIYVRNIYKYYVTYKLQLERQAKRAAARKSQQ